MADCMGSEQRIITTTKCNLTALVSQGGSQYVVKDTMAYRNASNELGLCKPLLSNIKAASTGAMQNLCLGNEN